MSNKQLEQTPSQAEKLATLLQPPGTRSVEDIWWQIKEQLNLDHLLSVANFLKTTGDNLKIIHASILADCKNESLEQQSRILVDKINSYFQGLSVVLLRDEKEFVERILKQPNHIANGLAYKLRIISKTRTGEILLEEAQIAQMAENFALTLQSHKHVN